MPRGYRGKPYHQQTHADTYKAYRIYRNPDCTDWMGFARIWDDGTWEYYLTTYQHWTTQAPQHGAIELIGQLPTTAAQARRAQQ